MSALRRTLIEVLKNISVVLFAVLVLVVLWQVFARQVLSDPSTWSTTVAQYLFVWLTLFALTFVFAERGHVAVDFFARKLPGPVWRAVAVLVQLSILAFAVLALVWGGIRGMGMSWGQAIPGLPVTVGQMYLALPIAGVLVAAVAIEDLVRAARGKDLAAIEDSAEEAAIAAVESSTDPVITDSDPEFSDPAQPAGRSTPAESSPTTRPTNRKER
ncbi:TRAP transporter small permease [Brachybacterium sp. p3-SID957]|uniref:TRAP transporter small permease n=1 Tax=Brachybacterium sp. p3-SID957 TaxID=2916049 RepID=UPI00223AFD20|nr:TRAP transporter small permease [Brachybacterium sp. p3-SID957]MCT1775295.1 TRAP transporter small permease [Brachybacterium sp. p3-SID957]